MSSINPDPDKYIRLAKNIEMGGRSLYRNLLVGVQMNLYYADPAAESITSWPGTWDEPRIMTFQAFSSAPGLVLEIRQRAEEIPQELLRRVEASTTALQALAREPNQMTAPYQSAYRDFLIAQQRQLEEAQQVRPFAAPPLPRVSLEAAQTATTDSLCRIFGLGLAEFGAWMPYTGGSPFEGWPRHGIEYRWTTTVCNAATTPLQLANASLALKSLDPHDPLRGISGVSFYPLAHALFPDTPSNVAVFPFRQGIDAVLDASRAARPGHYPDSEKLSIPVKVWEAWRVRVDWEELQTPSAEMNQFREPTPGHVPDADTTRCMLRLAAHNPPSGSRLQEMEDTKIRTGWIKVDLPLAPVVVPAPGRRQSRSVPQPPTHAWCRPVLSLYWDTVRLGMGEELPWVYPNQEIL